MHVLLVDGTGVELMPLLLHLLTHCASNAYTHNKINSIFVYWNECKKVGVAASCN